MGAVKDDGPWYDTVHITNEESEHELISCTWLQKLLVQMGKKL
jgi:hypothetical protein